jgi:hypothetical protein
MAFMLENDYMLHQQMFRRSMGGVGGKRKFPSISTRYDHRILLQYFLLTLLSISLVPVRLSS